MAARAPSNRPIRAAFRCVHSVLVLSFGVGNISKWLVDCNFLWVCWLAYPRRPCIYFTICCCARACVCVQCEERSCGVVVSVCWLGLIVRFTSKDDCTLSLCAYAVATSLPLCSYSLSLLLLCLAVLACLVIWIDSRVAQSLALAHFLIYVLLLLLCGSALFEPRAFYITYICALARLTLACLTNTLIFRCQFWVNFLPFRYPPETDSDFRALLFYIQFTISFGFRSASLICCLATWNGPLCVITYALCLALHLHTLVLEGSTRLISLFQLHMLARRRLANGILNVERR